FFFVIQYFLLHFCFYFFFYHFSNHNFHVFAHGQYHHSFYFFALSGNHFQVKYNTLYFIFIKCVLCEAVGSADQNHKTFKTFLFFTRKKKQKNLPSATSAKGGFALVLV